MAKTDKERVEQQAREDREYYDKVSQNDPTGIGTLLGQLITGQTSGYNPPAKGTPERPVYDQAWKK